MEKNKEGYLRLSKKLKKRPKSRQKAPIVFQLNGLFTFDAKKFLNQGDPIMANALPYEISPESGLMIDTEIEFKMAEVLFKLIY
jgi:CMP-N-acetylneuraminic acid synthetase